MWNIVSESRGIHRYRWKRDILKIARGNINYTKYILLNIEFEASYLDTETSEVNAVRFGASHLPGFYDNDVRVQDVVIIYLTASTQLPIRAVISMWCMGGELLMWSSSLSLTVLAGNVCEWTLYNNTRLPRCVK